MKKPNELAALNAVADLLPFLTGGRYTRFESPDEHNSSTPDVDAIFRPRSPDSPLLVVEHTTLEAFRGQLTYGHQSYDIVAKINANCRGLLPVDRYFILVVPNMLTDGLRKSAFTEFVRDASQWVISSAATLIIDQDTRMNYRGHSVLLICAGPHNMINGTVGRIPIRPDNQADLQVTSLAAAVDHGTAKFPKYKQQGYATLLALEKVSGGFYSTAFMELDDTHKEATNALVDYILAFDSYQDRMIVCNVWKELEEWHWEVPYNRRFECTDGIWRPLE